MEHRREIDGLRALAVLPVILQHAQFEFVPGGYIGVDIFFVISGFLISSIIYADAIQGKFSIVQFYERRARRIVPALIVVTLATSVAAYFVMLPDSYKNYGQSVFATLIFSNNVLLTLTSGYWSLASDFKPLLHTWSLGVEEQFYILYPLIVLVILRVRRESFATVLVVLALISFACSVLLSPSQPNASFYLLHTRAWELLLGALGAHYLHQTNRRHGNEALSVIGLGLILAAIVLIEEGMPYPYFYALLPCVGTVLVLVFARADTQVGRLLSSPPFVGIGLISYSAYLWHQPLFALVRVMRTREPSHWLYAALVVATLLLAYLTWRYVEQPFRDRTLFRRNQIFAATAASSIALGCFGVVVARTGGLPGRVPDLGLDGARYIAYNEGAFGFKRDAFIGDRPKRLLVLGNSTARDLINLIVESGRFERYEIIYRDDLNLCHPVEKPQLRELLRAADAIVVAADWMFDGKCQKLPFDALIQSGKSTLLVGPKHFGYNLDVFITIPSAERPQARATLLERTPSDNEQFRHLVPDGHYLDLLGIINRRYGGMPIFDDQGRILSMDRVHLTKAGAVLFSKIMFDDPVWRGFDLSPSRSATP